MLARALIVPLALALLTACGSDRAAWLQLELLPTGPALTGFCGDGTAFASSDDLERYSYPDLGRLVGGGPLPTSTGQVQCAQSAYLYRSEVGETRLSRDDGASWARLTAEDGLVTDAVVDPRRQLWRVVVGDDLWVERSTDDGETWERGPDALRMPDGSKIAFARFWRGGEPLVLKVDDGSDHFAALVLNKRGGLDRSRDGAPPGSPAEVITRDGRAFSRVAPEGAATAPALGRELWASSEDPLSDAADAWRPVLTTGWRRFDMASPPPSSLLLDPEGHLVLRRGALLFRSTTVADKDARKQVLQSKRCAVLEGEGVAAGGPGQVLLHNDTDGPVRVATLSAERLLWEHTARTDPETGAPSYAALEAGADLQLTSDTEPVVVFDATERCLGALIAGDVGEPETIDAPADTGTDTGADTGAAPEPTQVAAWWISKL